MTGYLWITLADAFGGERGADAGPFGDLDHAMRCGRDLARQHGQVSYTMAEFDDAGNQIGEAAAWLAVSCDVLGEADTARATTANDAPEPAPVAPAGEPTVTDGLAEIYARNLGESDMAPVRTVPSRWALKRRQEAERKRRRARR